MKNAVSAVIICRNDCSSLVRTIESLQAQTLTLNEIIVVNDGSTDNTRETAKKMGCAVVTNSEIHKESFVGRPELADVVNSGLSMVSESSEYVLILGADTYLHNNYLQVLVEKMNENKQIAITSGRILGEQFDKVVPRGSGRLVRKDFWMRVNNLKYPRIFGFEAWLIFKAIKEKYDTIAYEDVCFNTIRKSSRKVKQSYYFGHAMYVLGYDWKYSLGRCILKGPKYGTAMFFGWVWRIGLKKCDISSWIGQFQSKIVWTKVKKKLFRRR